MNRKFTLITFVFMIFLTFAQNDVYRAYPQGWGATWHYERVYYNGYGPVYSNYSYEWGGDTTINGITYTKMFSGVGVNHIYSCGIRQDILNEKLYMINYQGIEKDISFNQHAQIGDTILGTYFFPINFIDTLVFVVDEISLDQNNKLFNLRNINESHPLMNLNYMAGVGTLGFGGFEWGEGLQCHSIENNWVIGGADNPLCILNTDNLDLELSVKIYPNPSNGILFINKSPKDYEFRSLNGIKLNAQIRDNIIDLSQFKEGIYFVTLYYENDKMTTKKLVVN